MGYVHDTQMAKFIHPDEVIKSAGTWTATLASNVLSSVRSAADATFYLYIPVKLPSNAAALKGAYLKSIDVYYKIATAACDDFATVELEKQVLPAATGSDPSGSAVTVTQDTGHDTAAERKATGSHVMTVTLSTPVWIDDNDYYTLVLYVDAAATSVFTLWGARINWTLRV